MTRVSITTLMLTRTQCTSSNSTLYQVYFLLPSSLDARCIRQKQQKRLEPLEPLELLEPPSGCKTKTVKTPCARCKMSLASHWCCSCQKILEQAQTFSVSPIITPQGLCIHRKAINKDKHPVLWMVSYYRQDCHMQGKTVYSCLSPWGGWWPSVRKVMVWFRFGR